MSDYDLKGMQDSSKYQLSEMIGVIRLESDWANFRAQTRVVCDHFLTLAAASLLADMKPNFFFLNLCRCAENWRRFLVSSRDHFADQPTLSYAAPLHAAIISQDTSLINGILENLPAAYLKGQEYEDRFLVAKLLALLAANACQSSAVIEENLEALSKLDTQPVKVELFKALLEIDELKEEDFWSSFETALYSHEEETEKKIKSVVVKITEFIAHRFIWFEGLAFIRLAQTKGFTLPSNDIKYCPEEALGKMPQSYDGDWPLVPLPNEE